MALSRRQIGQLSIYGKSLASHYSGFIVNENNTPTLEDLESTGFTTLRDVWLDAGLNISPPPSVVLLTHTHWDHMHHLTTACLVADKPFPVYCAPEAYEPLRDFLHRFTCTRACNPNIKWCENLTKARLTPLDPDSEPVEFKPGFLVKTVRLEHRIPTVGYLILQKRTKLNPVIQSKKLSQKELVELSKIEKINIDVVVPILAYLCDCSSGSLTSTLSGLAANDQLPKVVMCECTFIEECDRDEARKRKHVLWQDVEETLTLLSSTRFVLFHLSKRYNQAQINKFKLNLPKNVTLFD